MVLTVSFSVTVITRDSVTLKVGPVCVGEASQAPGVSTSRHLPPPEEETFHGMFITLAGGDRSRDISQVLL